MLAWKQLCDQLTSTYILLSNPHWLTYVINLVVYQFSFSHYDIVWSHNTNLTSGCVW